MSYDAQSLQGRKISSEFFRVATADQSPTLGQLCMRQIALPCKNGTYSIHLQYRNEEGDLIDPLPRFIKEWLNPSQFKNLSLEEATIKLEEFSSKMREKGYFAALAPVFQLDDDEVPSFDAAIALGLNP